MSSSKYNKLLTVSPFRSSSALLRCITTLHEPIDIPHSRDVAITFNQENLPDVLVVVGAFSWKWLRIGKFVARVCVMAELVVFDNGPYFFCQETQVPTISILVRVTVDHRTDALKGDAPANIQMIG